jgi:DNA-binding LacI/PurR family transcriptional regulator
LTAAAAASAKKGSVGRNRVTLQTIADRLGVSRTTVSNAYNRPDQLAPDLRERVLATAAELGYTGPDPVARRLRSGGREAIGLLFTESLTYALTDPAAVLFLQGFARATEEAGLSMLILPGYSGRTGAPNAEREHRAAVREAVVAGFCAYSLPEENPDLLAAIERRLPLVVVDEPRGAGQTYVGVDDREGARAAAEHLVALGHRRVGVLSFRTADDGYAGPLTPEREAAATYPVTAERLAGWRDGLESGGLDWAAIPKQEIVLNSPEQAAAALPELLARAPEITALLCSTDQMALGARRAAVAAGRGDISFVGFDDIPAAAAADLTTVRQPLLEKGLTAGRLLVDGGGEAPREIILPVELVVRGSTRSP